MITIEQDARERLAEAYLPELKSLARNMTRGFPGVGMDEAFSAGLIGVAEALKSFDPSRGAPFAAYAGTMARSRIVDMIRTCRNHTPIDEIGDDPDELHDSRQNIPPVGWDLEYADWVASLSRTLPPRHGQLIRLHYLEAESADLKGCARRMGIKPGRAGEIHVEALAMLRESFGGSSAQDAPAKQSRRAGANRGKAKDLAVAAIAEMVAAGIAITIPAVAKRSGISVAHVGSMRKALMQEGRWPEGDGRRLNGGGYWQDRKHRAGDEVVVAPPGQATV